MMEFRLALALAATSKMLARCYRCRIYMPAGSQALFYGAHATSDLCSAPTVVIQECCLLFAVQTPKDCCMLQCHCCKPGQCWTSVLDHELTWLLYLQLYTCSEMPAIGIKGTEHEQLSVVWCAVESTAAWPDKLSKSRMCC